MKEIEFQTLATPQLHLESIYLSFHNLGLGFFHSGHSPPGTTVLSIAFLVFLLSRHSYGVPGPVFGMGNKEQQVPRGKGVHQFL